MQHTYRLYRQLLLVALLLLSLPSGMAVDGAIRHSGTCDRQAAITAGKHYAPAHAITHGDAGPHEMVLTGVYVPSASGIYQRGPSGGAARYGCVTFYGSSAALPQHISSPCELRRWRRLWGGIQHAQITARYPAHGFW